jgi:hypothetical protein
VARSRTAPGSREPHPCGRRFPHRLKNAVLGDRMSCHAFAANQFRPDSPHAYILTMPRLVTFMKDPGQAAWNRSISACDGG